MLTFFSFLRPIAQAGLELSDCLALVVLELLSLELLILLLLFTSARITGYRW